MMRPHFPGVDLADAISQLRDEREKLEVVALTGSCGCGGRQNPCYFGNSDRRIKDLAAELCFLLERRETDLYETRK